MLTFRLPLTGDPVAVNLRASFVLTVAAHAAAFMMGWL